MKEKIIDAAIAEFTSSGLKFTMSDLAKRLCISKKTIYTIIDSKHSLLIAIADRYGEDFGRMQKEIEADPSSDEVQKLERLLCALPDQYCDIGLNRIYELKEKDPKAYRHLMVSVNQGWKLVERYLKAGMEKGMIREVSIPVVMAMVKGTVHSFMQTGVLYENGLSYEQGKIEMVKILMKGIERL